VKRFGVGACAALAAALGALALASPEARAAACDDPAANAIVKENCKPGTAAGVWDTNGDSSIQGFATDMSVDQGQRVDFKIDTPSTDYRLDIYRLGYYGGAGARMVATVRRTGAQTQPPCDRDDVTGLVDCGDWAVSASWTVPADAVSGIYFAHVVREDGQHEDNHIVFVVRDDDGASDLLFQTSDTTWQAYNEYAGNSLYTGSPDGRAYEVSYNRPFTTRDNSREDWLFNAEYPMVRWLERNGYDVSYFTGVDSDRLGAELLEHKAFLSVGHDEYWSGAQRANVAAARDAGVDLAFFSGNEVFWKTRWEDDHRTLVSYKETHAGAKIDPVLDTWTGTWRDARPFNPEGGQPENALTGTAFTVNSGSAALRVPAADGLLRFWRNSSVADQAPGDTAVLTADTVGYEWDEDLDNGARPAGLMRLSSTTVEDVDKLQDYGSAYASGTATHTLTLHREANGALVFGAGTVQWSWGLDGEHDRGSAPASPAMQQATVNLFADMGVQPGDLQTDLQPASASTDTQAPAATITSAPAAVTAGTPVTVAGTAADTGGGRVAAVEVSRDGGSTWHPASGRERWTFMWTPSASGAPALRVRAVDDSGNLAGGTPAPPAGTPGPPAGSPGGTPPAPPPGTPGGTPPAPSGAGQGGATATPNTGAGTPAAGSGTATGGRQQARSPAARVIIRPRRVRISRDGAVRLRLSCRSGERGCRVRLRLLLGSRLIGGMGLAMAPGQTRTVALKLRPAARRALLRQRSLQVTALAAVRDQGGTAATTRTSIRVLPR
jgi:hypothetical protein